MKLYLNKKYVLIDNEDFDFINQWHWTYDETGYAHRKIKGNKKIYLHRIIMGNPKGKTIDHINGNHYDCRKINLRICTFQQNLYNSKLNIRNKSGYRGVSYIKNRNKWQAYIQYKYKNYYLGKFDSPSEAAKIYNLKAKEFFGIYARFNKIEDPEQLELL